MNNRECVEQLKKLLADKEISAPMFHSDVVAIQHAITALNAPAIPNRVDELVAMLTARWSKSGIEESRKDRWWAGYDAGRCGCAIDLQSAMLARSAVTDRPHLEGVTDDAVELAAKAIFEDQCPLDSWAAPIPDDERESWRECGRLALAAAYPALMRDAERYRWLRNQAENSDLVPFIARRNTNGISQFNGDQADAAIDAAMQEEKP